MDGLAKFFFVSGNEGIGLAEADHGSSGGGFCHSGECNHAFVGRDLGEGMSARGGFESRHKSGYEGGSGGEDDVLGRLLNEVRAITSVVEDREEKDRIENEWKRLAKLMDCIFFVVYIVLFITTSLIFLSPLFLS